MSKVILHIGTHKTASTSIQNTFWENAPLLQKRGIIYPRLGDHKPHHGLVLNETRLPEEYHIDGGSHTALAKISDKYAKTDYTVFLSTEEFSRALQLKEIGRLREALSAFDEIEVICMLRTQWQFLQSIYLEVSKTRISPRPPMLVDPVFHKRMHDGLWIDYNCILDELEKTFDPSEITFFDFNTSCKAEGGIVGHMMAHLGIADLLPKFDPVTVNVSPLSLASWAANILCEPRVATKWVIAQTTEALRLEYGDDAKPCLFTREEFARMEQHYGACNAELQRRRAPYQPGFAISPPNAKSLHPFREDISSGYWVQAARQVVKNR